METGPMAPPEAGNGEAAEAEHTSRHLCEFSAMMGFGGDQQFAQRNQEMPSSLPSGLMINNSNNKLGRDSGSTTENGTTNKHTKYHHTTDMIPPPPSSSQSSDLPTASICADYFSLFLPQHELHPHHLLDPSVPIEFSSNLFKDSVHHQNGKISTPYQHCSLSDPPVSSTESASSIPTSSASSKICSSTASSTASSSSSMAAKSQDRKRPYPCTICESRFGSKMELEEHQNSHTGMKPFQCDVCQSRFNRRSTLWNHKRIHSDAKPFKCTVCHMQFKWKNSLKCHNNSVPHREMHLRKNELAQEAVPEADTQMLTYATAAKKSLGTATAGASCSSETATTSSMALLPSTGIPSRLLTCAGTPRKRAPPKSGGTKGGKATNNKERTAEQNGRKRNIVMEQQHTFGGANLFNAFGATTIMPEMGQPKKQAAQEIAALRREQALQQRHQPQQPPGTSAQASGFDLVRFQCGKAATIASECAAPSIAQPFFPFDQHVPLTLEQHHLQTSSTHQQMNNSTINNNAQHHPQSHQQQQHNQLDFLACNGTTNGLHLMDPSLLLQDFQLSQQAPVMPFLGFDLQQQLSTLAHPVQENSNNQTVMPHTQSSSSTSSSALSMFHSYSNCAVVPCSTATSSASYPTNSSSATSNTGFDHLSNNGLPLGPSSSEMVLNGYQFDPASMRFLAAAADVQQQHHISEAERQQVHHLQQTEQMAAYGIFSPCEGGTMGEYGGMAIEQQREQQPYGPQSGQFHLGQQQQQIGTAMAQNRSAESSKQQIKLEEAPLQQQQQQQQHEGATIAISY